MTIKIRPQQVWADLASVKAVIGTETVDVPIIGLASVDVNGNISVGSVTVGTVATPSATITRPNDTTTYATGEVMANATGAICEITGCARIAGGSGTIISMIAVSSANQALKAQLELWLFDMSVTQDADNALFTPTDAECLNLVGIIPLNTSYVGDATAGAGGNYVSAGADQCRRAGRAAFR